MTSTNDESELSAILAAFDVAHSGLAVYLKSRARRFGPDVRMQATISARGADLDGVTARVDEVIDAFRSLLAVVYDE